MAGDGSAPQPGRLDRHHSSESRHRQAEARVEPGGTTCSCSRTPSSIRARTHRGAGERRPAPADFHLLPSRPGHVIGGGTDPSSARRPADSRDRSCVPRTRANDGAAPGEGEEEDQGRQHPVSGPRRCRPAGSARLGPDGRLPHLQRGLLGIQRRRVVANGPCPRGVETCPSAYGPDARRAGSSRPLGAPSPLGVTSPGPHYSDGSIVLLADQDRNLWDRDTHRRRPGSRPSMSAKKPARPVPDTGGDRGGSQ